MRIAKENKFNSLERPKQLLLLKDLWTSDDLLTPTFKLKRNVAKQQYAEQIVQLYESPIMKETK